jgi:hypothetical protein
MLFERGLQKDEKEKRKTKDKERKMRVRVDLFKIMTMENMCFRLCVVELEH